MKITASLTIIVILELFYFIVAISNSVSPKIKVPLIASSILGLALIVGIFIIEDEKNFLTRMHPQEAIFFMLLFIYAGLGTAILFEKSLKSSLLSHSRALYTLVSFALLVVAITVLYVFLPIITGQSEYLWLGPVLAFLFLVSFIFGHSLTKEKAKRKEAESLAEEWGKLASAKDQLLLSLQHHLRTPIGPIKGYLERILEGTYGREENPVIKEKLIEIKKLVDNLYSLMENLLYIQELRVGKKSLDLEDCQIEALIKNVIEELKLEAEQKNIYLKYELAAGTGEKLPTLMLNKSMIKEAIWNLVNNAVKYTNRGGVTVKLKVENEEPQPISKWAGPRPSGKGRWLKIGVTDTGIGMEKEEIDYFLRGKLFERSAAAKKLYGPGRGIGLSIVFEFVKAHGGRTWAESEGWGKGTTFWIELPIKGSG
ncbi:MAG: PAS/PAC sensor hybrid histidine kinase [Parcubacteria group bacterium Gr01-1014_30]|nr:MAG: PAS/PAC sensor hybrid histidine kinase [Parcubacteria group bacterium Gr01-1014_30]